MHIPSKWVKTKVLLKHSQIKPYIPKTRIMTKSALYAMLKQYRMVYVKPIAGSFGLGVMRVERVSGRDSTAKYRYQKGTKVRTFRDYDSMYNSLLKTKSRILYIAQRGIELLKYQNRRFDIRVMVQKDPRGQWEATGVIGRQAQAKKIVTNFHNGGKPLPLSVLLKPHLHSDGRTAAYTRKLKSLGIQISKAMNKTYPKMNMIGIDVGVGKDLKPWIIEVNTNPDPYIFNKLKDKSIYRKMYRYARRLGRRVR